LHATGVTEGCDLGAPGRDETSFDPRTAMPHFVTDEEARLFEEGQDAFAHRDYAEVLARCLTVAPSPFVMGLFGAWGCGKSSIIRALPEQLGQDTAFACFDVWKYEGESLRRCFIKTIAHDFEAGGVLRKSYKPTRRLADLDVDEQTAKERGIGLSVWSAVRFIVVAGASLVLLAGAYWIVHRLGWASKNLSGPSLGSVAVSLLLVWLSFALAQMLGFVHVATTTMTRRRIEEPDRFAEKFEELLAAVNCKRVVIAIDNLDRCSPDRVAEVLSTIKTYLQPAAAQVGRSGSKSRTVVAEALSTIGTFLRPTAGQAGGSESKSESVVFVIAADREAIRAHLVENEGEGDDTGAGVDEYLRKFFNAVITIRDPVEDDIREYANSILAGFPYFVILSGEERALLVHIVCAALRHNPRRIKQFANNLGVRWELLRHGAKQHHLPARVADDHHAVLLLAKLAVIEEAWPDEFKRLRANPRQLDASSREAVREPNSEPADYFSFLRNSERVTSEDVHALMTLYQSDEELALPRFGEYRSALVFGDSRTLEDVLADVSDDQLRAFADRLPVMMREEVQKRHDVQAALNILSGTLHSDRLMGHQAITRDVLVLCSDTPWICNVLTNIDAGVLFASLHLLDESRRERILLPFAQLDGLVSRGVPVLEGACEAFSALPGSLPGEVLRRLRQYIVQPQVVDNIAACSALVERYPDLASEACDRKAAELLEASFAAPSPLLRYHVARFGAGEEEAFQDRVLELSVQSEQFREGEEQELGDWLESVHEAIPAMRAITADPAARFLTALQTRLSAMTRPQQVLAMAIVGGLAERFPSLGETELFTKELFAEVDGGLAYVGSGQIPASLVHHLVARMSEVANAASMEEATRAGHALITLPEGRVPFVQAVSARVRADRFGDAWMLLDGHLPPASTDASGSGDSPPGQLSREDLETVIGTLLERMSQVGAESLKGAIEFAAHLLAFFEGDQIDTLANRLMAGISSADLEKVRVALDGAATLEDEAAFQPSAVVIARHALGFLLPADALDDCRMLCLQHAGRERRHLQEEELDGLAKQVGKWLASGPAYRFELLQEVRLFAVDPAERRLVIVRGVLAAEAGEPNEALERRTDLLVAAREVVGRRPSRAKALVDERVTELAHSDRDEDQAVARLVLDRADALT
jgi:hypothetical protein